MTVPAWHFTSALHWPHIEAAGKLRRTESNLDMFTPRAGPDVVWLMDGPELGGLPHGLAGSAADKTEDRFEVEAPDRWTVRWLDWANAQGIDRKWLETLVRVGGGMEAARRWLISFKEIPRGDWVRVENTGTGQVYHEREGGA